MTKPAFVTSASPHRVASLAAAAILGLAAAASAARAQGAPEIPGATLTNPVPDAGQYLGNVYKDEVAGFKIAPPVNARVIAKAGKVDLLTFIQESKFAGGTLQRIETTIPLEDYVQNVVAEMNKSFKAVQIQENRRTRFQNFNAIRLTTTMMAELGSGLPTGVEQQMRGANRARNEEVALLRHQLIVQTRQHGFMVLTYYSPLRNREEATRTFEAVAGSFEILNQTDLKKRRVDAFMLGKKWLSERSTEDLRPKLNNQPSYFRMVVGGVNGADAGYWWQTERNNSRDGFKGIEVEVCSRSFPNDPPGSLTQVRYMCFWANPRNDKGELTPHYSMWDYITRTDVRLPSDRDPTRLEPKAFWIQESGTLTLEGDPRYTDDVLRQLEADRERFIRDNPTKPRPPAIPKSTRQFRMIVNLSGDKGQRLPDGINKPFPPDEAAGLPKIFEYTWPRLVELNKPSEMSFVVFNSLSKKLALRTLIVTGQKERITVNGRSMECWKCIDELDPGSTNLWVDDAGQIMMMRTSDQTVMLPTTKQEMDRIWSARLREWQQ